MSSADVAAGYVRRMVEKETRGWGDQEGALGRLEARYGLPFWSLNHISVEKALHEDDTIQDLERQAARLASQIAAKKAAMKFPG